MAGPDATRIVGPTYFNGGFLPRTADVKLFLAQNSWDTRHMGPEGSWLEGRRQELAKLDLALKAATEGGPSLVLIEGEAGIGKTRLADEICRRAAGHGFHVRVGRTPPVIGPDLPLVPVVAALRDLFPATEPFHGRGWAAASMRASGFDSLLVALEEVSRARPTLLLLEDMHWADFSTWEFLSFLAAGLKVEAIVVVATVRTPLERPELQEILAELHRHPTVRRVPLAPLADDEIVALLAHSDVHGLGEERTAEIVDLAEGNPFVALELATSTVEGNVPTTLAESVILRLDQAGTSGRLVTEVLAVLLGPEKNDDLLQTVTGLGPDELAEILRRCVELRLVVPQASGYDFAHALTRVVIDDRILPAERRLWHARIAAALEAPGAPDNPDGVLRLAHHWHESGDFHRAAPATLRAGAVAIARYAYPEAAELLARAGDLFKRHDPQDDRLPDIYARAAEAARWAGLLNNAVSLIEKALELPLVQQNPILHAKLLERLGRYEWEHGNPDRLIEACLQAESLLEVAPHSSVLADVLAAHGTALMINGDYDTATNLCRRAITLAAEVEDPFAEGQAEATLGVLAAHSDGTDAGVRHLRRALTIASERAEVEIAMRAAVNLSYVLCTAGRFEEAVSSIVESRGLITRLGGPTAAVFELDHNAAAIQTLTGRFDDALSTIESLRDKPLGSTADYLDVLRLEIATARGEDQTIAHLIASLRERSATPRLLTTVIACAAEHALTRGRPDRAIVLVKDGLDRLAGSSYYLGAARLVAAGYRGLADEAAKPQLRDPPSARPLTPTLAVELSKRLDVLSGQLGIEPEMDAYVATARAELCRFRGDADGTAWHTAVTAWHTAQQPYREAYALCRLAQSSLRYGHRDRAAQALASARSTGTELASEPILTAVDALASAARLDLHNVPPKSATLSAAGLTQREQQVLDLIVNGLTNRLIARKLFISERTVDVHVSNVLRKLGVANRMEAVVMIIRDGQQR